MTTSWHYCIGLSSRHSSRVTSIFSSGGDNAPAQRRVRTRGAFRLIRFARRNRLPVEQWRVRIWSMSKRNPTLLDRELLAMVRSGMFRSQAEAVQEALGTFFAAKPQYRLA